MLAAIGSSGAVAAAGVRVQAAAAQTATIRLVPEVVKTTTPGSYLSFQIWLDDPVELGGFQFTLLYPEDLLEFQSVEIGPLLGSTGREVIELPVQTGEGSVTYGAVSAPGHPGASVSGVLATVRFLVAGAGRTQVEIGDAEATDTSNTPIPLELGPPAPVSIHTGIFLPFAHTS
jgi:hypothetical protein